LLRRSDTCVSIRFLTSLWAWLAKLSISHVVDTER
jgi:hypothetical protein